MNIETAEQFLTQHGTESVRVEWSDLHGISRGKYMSRANFLGSLSCGTAFSSAALYMDLRGDAHAPAGGTGQHSWVSIYAVPDISTLQPYVIEPGVARCLADLVSADGRKVVEAPRNVLQRVAGEGRAMGLETSIGLELEFYLLQPGPDRQPSVGRQVYRMQGSAEEKRFLDPLSRQMEEAGVGVEAICAEDGPGQFEIILQRGSALAMADASFTVRNLVKEMAARQGLAATFLSRPLAAFSGCGAHIHQSLWSSSGQPLFVPHLGDGDAIFWSYLAGQLHHFQEACAFYLPTINSYKRLALRQPDPLSINWGFEGRNVTLRVLSSGDRSLRIENRAVAGEANPYLSIAACLACGFEGVRSAEHLPELPSPDRPTSSASVGEPPPRRLDDALNSLEGSEMMRRWFGPEVIDAFIRIKRSEVRRYECAITDWELAEYVDGL